MATPRMPSGSAARNGSQVRAELVIPCRKSTVRSPLPARSITRTRPSGSSTKRFGSEPGPFSEGGVTQARAALEREDDRAEEAESDAIDAERRQRVALEEPQQELDCEPGR